MLSEKDKNEMSDKEDNALDNAIETGENAARTPEEQAVIDKARRDEQQLEQEKGNTARANETARQAQSDLESAKSENEKLQEQLEAAEAKAAEAGISDVELKEDDYEGTDLAIVRSIKGLKQTIEAKDKRIASLEKKATGYEEQDRKDKALQVRDSVYEELLTDLDTEYGADCRNAAVKKFQELSAEGKVPKNNPAKATRIMERCYKEAKTAKDKAAKDKGKDKSSLSLDLGSGGGSAPNLSGIEVKEGSLDEVDEQYSKTEFGARKS